MKRLVVTLIAVSFLAAGSLALASDMVTLTAKNGNVTFNHKAHQDKMECKVCHGEGTPAKIELDKDKAHALCKDCHTTKGAGPTKCNECHKK